MMKNHVVTLIAEPVKQAGLEVTEIGSVGFKSFIGEMCSHEGTEENGIWAFHPSSAYR